MEITIFDGSNTIGGNKIYLNQKGRGVFLDFGLNYKKQGEYYEEFLRERSSRGVHDQLRLDLLPKIDLYRRDLLTSDIDSKIFQHLPVEAVFVSHAHMDHCGHISYLRGGIPIGGSPITLALMKGIRDTTKQGNEVAYYVEKNPMSDGRLLKSNSATPYTGRDYISTDRIPSKLEDFISTRPGTKDESRKKFNPGSISALEEVSLSFEIKSFDVDHSIYGASAFAVSGDDHTIVYSGDIRLHGALKDKTQRFVREARSLSPHVLITEGTRASRADEYETESDVHSNCLSAVEKADDAGHMVIADFSPRNFERLDTFKSIAKKTGRKLVITSKDAYLLHALECGGDACRIDDLFIYKELKSSEEKWETEVVYKEYGDRYLDPLDIRKDAENIILCFSFFDMKHLLDIDPVGGTYIYSSSEAYTEEQEVDFLRLSNWLKRFDFNVVGFSLIRENGRTKSKRVKGYHASGHASGGELLAMIEEINPECVIPVHTERPGFFQDNLDMDVKIPLDGKPMKIS